MIVYLLFIAAVNIGLGVGLALVYDYFVPPPWALAYAADPEDEGVGRVAREADLRPQHWHTIVRDLGVEAAGPRESALWVLLHRTEQLNRRLTQDEMAARSNNLPSAEADAWTCAVHELSLELRQAAEYLPVDGEEGDVTQPLRESLLDFAGQLDNGVRQFQSTGAGDTRRPAERRRDALHRQVDLTFRLRDDLEERLAQELRVLGRVVATPAPLRLDHRLSLYNRIGLEYLLYLYNQESNDEANQVAVALIDIDRFERVNRQLGVRDADRLLHSFARSLEDSLRQNRGFDRVARLGGQSFVLLLGNTALADAEYVCERLRQNIEAASFKVGDAELEMTVSCSAVALGPGESLSRALRRLRTALAETRRAGRNRTCIDTGSERRIIQPKQLQVCGQMIEIAAAP